MKCKILEKLINNKGSLIKEPTVDNIISHPMNNDLKNFFVNEKLNQLSINNILKEASIDDKKSEINDTLEKTIVCNILKDSTISNTKYLSTNIKESKIDKVNKNYNNKKLMKINQLIKELMKN